MLRPLAAIGDGQCGVEIETGATISIRIALTQPLRIKIRTKKRDAV